eukprot:24509_1
MFVESKYEKQLWTATAPGDISIKKRKLMYKGSQKTHQLHQIDMSESLDELDELNDANQISDETNIDDDAEDRDEEQQVNEEPIQEDTAPSTHAAMAPSESDESKAAEIDATETPNELDELYRIMTQHRNPQLQSWGVNTELLKSMRKDGVVLHPRVIQCILDENNGKIKNITIHVFTVKTSSFNTVSVKDLFNWNIKQNGHVINQKCCAKKNLCQIYIPNRIMNIVNTDPDKAAWIIATALKYNATNINISIEALLALKSGQTLIQPPRNDKKIRQILRNSIKPLQCPTFKEKLEYCSKAIALQKLFKRNATGSESSGGETSHSSLDPHAITFVSADPVSPMDSASTPTQSELNENEQLSNQISTNAHATQQQSVRNDSNSCHYFYKEDLNHRRYSTPPYQMHNPYLMHNPYPLPQAVHPNAMIQFEKRMRLMEETIQAQAMKLQEYEQKELRLKANDDDRTNEAAINAMKNCKEQNKPNNEDEVEIDESKAPKANESNDSEKDEPKTIQTATISAIGAVLKPILEAVLQPLCLKGAEIDKEDDDKEKDDKGKEDDAKAKDKKQRIFKYCKHCKKTNVKHTWSECKSKGKRKAKEGKDKRRESKGKRNTKEGKGRPKGVKTFKYCKFCKKSNVKHSRRDCRMNPFESQRGTQNDNSQQQHNRSQNHHNRNQQRRNRNQQRQEHQTRSNDAHQMSLEIQENILRNLQQLNRSWCDGWNDHHKYLPPLLMTIISYLKRLKHWKLIKIILMIIVIVVFIIVAIPILTINCNVPDYYRTIQINHHKSQSKLLTLTQVGRLRNGMNHQNRCITSYEWWNTNDEWKNSTITRTAKSFLYDQDSSLIPKPVLHTSIPIEDVYQKMIEEER